MKTTCNLTCFLTPMLGVLLASAVACSNDSAGSRDGRAGAHRATGSPVAATKDADGHDVRVLAYVFAGSGEVWAVDRHLPQVEGKMRDRANIKRRFSSEGELASALRWHAMQEGDQRLLGGKTCSGTYDCAEPCTAQGDLYVLKTTLRSSICEHSDNPEDICWDTFGPRCRVEYFEDAGCTQRSSVPGTSYTGDYCD